MKKFGLSSFVIITFFLYALHHQLKASEVPAATSAATTHPSQSSDAPSPATPDTPLPQSLPSPSGVSGYKDGTYTGDSADAFYGNVQVQATIQAGKITDVKFLDYPHDRGTSIFINSQAMPYLKSEAVQAQSANVDIVSGATQTSLAFIQSLGSALAKAH